MASDNLGPPEAWTIKAFPRDLRKKITQEAAHAGLSVGEYVTRLILGGAPAPSSSPAPQPPSPDDLRNLMEAAAAATAASGQPMPKRAAGRFHRYVDDHVRVAAGLPPRQTRKPPLRIAAPDSPTPVESEVPAMVGE